MIGGRDRTTTAASDLGLFVGRVLDPHRIADRLCLVFAGWTVLCHAVVILGGSLNVLLVVSSAAIVLAVTGWAVIRPGARTHRDDEPEPRAAVHQPDYKKTPLITLVSALAAGFGLAVWAAALMGVPPLVIWVLSAILLVTASGFALATGSSSARSPAATRNGFIWGLALLCVMVTLCSNRPDLDDSLYVCMAASVSDHPGEPLLARDHLHGVDGLPMLLPTYRVHAIEPLAGALARLTGVPAMSWLHLVFGPLAAMLAVFALARVASKLAPRRWEWVTGATVMILVVVGDAHAWYGNLALVRIHQGKAVFATALVPLIIAYGIEFARRPGRGPGLRLAAAQIAAVGTTATALWAAPAVAVVAVVSTIRFDRNGVRTLGLGLATVIYPAVLASAFWFGMHHPENPIARSITGAPPAERSLNIAPPPSSEPPRPAAVDVARKAEKTFVFVLGEGRLPMAALGLLLWGWWCSPESEVRKFHLCFAAFFAAFWVNPFLIPFLVSSVTGGDTYWRVFWTLPLPLLGAFFLTSPLVRFRWRWGPIVTLVSIVLVLVGVRSAPVFGGPKGARFGPPTLKVPAEYEAARALVERVPRGSAVVAPTDVGAWVTTFHHHPFPVVVRRHYLHHISAAVGGDETLLRLQATVAVTKPGRSKAIDGRLFELVDDRPIAGVVVATAGFQTDRLEGGLEARGYSVDWTDGTYRIWVKD